MRSPGQELPAGLLLGFAASIAVGMTITWKRAHDRLQNNAVPLEAGASMTTFLNRAEDGLELGIAAPGRAGVPTMMVGIAEDKDTSTAEMTVQERIRAKLKETSETSEEKTKSIEMEISAEEKVKWETAELQTVLTSSGDATEGPKGGDIREAYYCNDLGCWVAQQVYCDETGCWLDDTTSRGKYIVNGQEVSSKVETYAERVEREMMEAIARGGASKVKAPQGIFAPAVLGAKKVMGEQKLKEFRASVIAEHTKVISNFVDTSDSPFGQIVLRQMFEAADKDGSGDLSKEEVRDALNALGFTFIEDKQMAQIWKRADKDGNNVIDFEEFVQETPKTLRTSLVKLAKQNGHDLGFLV